jgi:hypothetical protein
MLQFLKIRPSLFWDVDKNLLTEENNRTFIIERVINLGNLAEWNGIVNYYGLDIIKEEVLKAGDLYPKTISFIESYLEIHKTKLSCFIRKQLNQPHWNL